MRSALTLFWLMFVALSMSRAAARSDFDPASIGGAESAVELTEGPTFGFEAKAKLGTPRARRWESSEGEVDVAATRGNRDRTLTRNDVRSTELFPRPALASAMSLVEQASRVENWVGARVLTTPARTTAELHRVRGRQSDP